MYSLLYEMCASAYAQNAGELMWPLLQLTAVTDSRVIFCNKDVLGKKGGSQLE